MVKVNQKEALDLIYELDVDMGSIVSEDLKWLFIPDDNGKIPYCRHIYLNEFHIVDNELIFMRSAVHRNLLVMRRHIGLDMICGLVAPNLVKDFLDCKLDVLTLIKHCNPLAMVSITSNSIYNSSIFLLEEKDYSMVYHPITKEAYVSKFSPN